MRMVLAIAALASIAVGLIAVGRAWYEFRPLTDKERARLRQTVDVLAASAAGSPSNVHDHKRLGGYQGNRGGPGGVGRAQHRIKSADRPAICDCMFFA
jgi:hypothetical protein